MWLYAYRRFWLRSRTVVTISASTVPGELALTLSAVIQGGYVLARAHGSQEPMDTAIRGAVALIEAARAAARPA